MVINEKKITVRELVQGYNRDEETDSVVGYGGLLNIRPSYQRAFIYKPPQQKAVIDSISHGFPLNAMYWVDKGDGTYELLDGQQRTTSICEYVCEKGKLAACIFDNDSPRYFDNLLPDEAEIILSYPLTIYICKGTDSEKLQWFKTINIAGEELKDQEIRNAIFSGPWIADAKRYFSKTNCPAKGIGSDYVNPGECNRQLWLELAIRWACDNGDIDLYMAQHQHDDNAYALWQHFQNVITWATANFSKKDYGKLTKRSDWYELWKAHHDRVLPTTKFKTKVHELLQDGDIDNQNGIIPYLLTGDEMKLRLRTFDEKTARKKYKEQGGLCPECVRRGKNTASKIWKFEEMEADHIIPWSKGGRTEESNCQMLCRSCNRTKSNH